MKEKLKTLFMSTWGRRIAKLGGAYLLVELCIAILAVLAIKNVTTG